VLEEAEEEYKNSSSVQDQSEPPVRLLRRVPQDQHGRESRQERKESEEAPYQKVLV